MYGSIHISRGPTFLVVIAIPRNMGLFDVASTNACGLTMMKCIQSIKNVVYYIAHSMSFYSAFSVDRSMNIYCTLNALFFLHSVDGPLII